MTLEFYGQSLENTQITNFILKNRSVADELFHKHGWTDRHEEANSWFSPFC